MKKILIGVLLFLGIVTPYAEINATLKDVVYSILAAGFVTGEGIACALAGLKLGEAIQKRDPKILSSLYTVGASGLLGYRFYTLLSEVPGAIRETSKSKANLQRMEFAAWRFSRVISVLACATLYKVKLK